MRLSSTLGDQVGTSWDLVSVIREFEADLFCLIFTGSLSKFQLELGCVRQLTSVISLEQISPLSA